MDTKNCPSQGLDAAAEPAPPCHLHHLSYVSFAVLNAALCNLNHPSLGNVMLHHLTASRIDPWRLSDFKTTRLRQSEPTRLACCSSRHAATISSIVSSSRPHTTHMVSALPLPSSLTCHFVRSSPVRASKSRALSRELSKKRSCTMALLCVQYRSRAGLAAAVVFHNSISFVAAHLHTFILLQ